MLHLSWRLVWQHKMACSFIPAAFYGVLLWIFVSHVILYCVIWWIVTEVLEVPAATIFKYDCDSNSFHWFVSVYLPLYLSHINPKSTVLREVLRIVTVSFETWIIPGKIMWRDVICSANTAIIMYTLSVEEINILYSCEGYGDCRYD
jgi:hypothetical protein